MKKIFFLLCLFASLSACKTTLSTAKVSHQLKGELALSLQMPDSAGFNGGGIAFCKKNKKYYAAFAGNKYFPMQAFNTKGNSVGSVLKARTDMRGLWYNPKAQQLEANGFGQEPIVKYIFNDGLPDETEKIISDIKKPDAQCVASYDYDSDEILMFSEGSIYRFNHTSGELLGDYILKSMPEDYNLNENTLAYTGIKDGEIALLDYKGKKVYLFQKNTGEFKGTILLPENAPTNRNFNFGFANQKVWLFDTDKRIWLGYQVK